MGTDMALQDISVSLRRPPALKAQQQGDVRRQCDRAEALVATGRWPRAIS